MVTRLLAEPLIANAPKLFVVAPKETVCDTVFVLLKDVYVLLPLNVVEEIPNCPPMTTEPYVNPFPLKVRPVAVASARTIVEDAPLKVNNAPPIFQTVPVSNSVTVPEPNVSVRGKLLFDVPATNVPDEKL